MSREPVRAAPPVAATSPAAAPPSAEIPSLVCDGALQQGGLVLCQSAPGTVVRFGSAALTADTSGTTQFGLDRSAGAELVVSSAGTSLTLAIAPRHDERRDIGGLDCDKIDARTEAQKAHAAASWQLKQVAFKTLLDGPGASQGFSLPADAPMSSPFGPVRRYTGTSAATGAPCDSESVHQGYDLATPVGTPVVAPAAGVVTLADPDLYYEGGTVFLDHGHGLVSVFMHLSAVSVAAGDKVERGDLLAKSGNTGRTTGPHLHWGVKWRNPAITDRSGDYYIDPALLLGLPPSD